MDKLNLAGDTAGVEVSENKPEVEGTVDELDNGVATSLPLLPLPPRFAVIFFLLVSSVSSPSPLS